MADEIVTPPTELLLPGHVDGDATLALLVVDGVSCLVRRDRDDFYGRRRLDPKNSRSTCLVADHPLDQVHSHYELIGPANIGTLLTIISELQERIRTVENRRIYVSHENR